MIKRSMKQSVEALRWKNGRLEMLDQRVLSARFEYLTFSSAIEIAEGIRSMVVRGAPIIGCAAAYGMALEAQRLRDTTPREFARAMDKAFEVLAESSTHCNELVLGAQTNASSVERYSCPYFW